jgi:hypothetical protein
MWACTSMMIGFARGPRDRAGAFVFVRAGAERRAPRAGGFFLDLLMVTTILRLP